MKHLASLSLALIALAVPALAQTSTGTITVNGKKAPLDHVVAIHKDANVRLLLSNKEVTAVSINGQSDRTRTGVGVGSTEQQVKNGVPGVKCDSGNHPGGLPVSSITACKSPPVTP